MPLKRSLLRPSVWPICRATQPLAAKESEPLSPRATEPASQRTSEPNSQRASLPCQPGHLRQPSTPNPQPSKSINQQSNNLATESSGNPTAHPRRAQASERRQSERSSRQQRASERAIEHRSSRAVKGAWRATAKRWRTKHMMEQRRPAPCKSHDRVLGAHLPLRHLPGWPGGWLSLASPPWLAGLPDSLGGVANRPLISGWRLLVLLVWLWGACLGHDVPRQPTQMPSCLAYEFLPGASRCQPAKASSQQIHAREAQLAG